MNGKINQSIKITGRVNFQFNRMIEDEPKDVTGKETVGWPGEGRVFVLKIGKETQLFFIYI